MPSADLSKRHTVIEITPSPRYKNEKKNKIQEWRARANQFNNKTTTISLL